GRWRWLEWWPARTWTGTVAHAAATAGPSDRRRLATTAAEATASSASPAKSRLGVVIWTSLKTLETATVPIWLGRIAHPERRPRGCDGFTTSNVFVGSSVAGKPG